METIENQKKVIGIEENGLPDPNSKNFLTLCVRVQDAGEFRSLQVIPSRRTSLIRLVRHLLFQWLHRARG